MASTQALTTIDEEERLTVKLGDEFKITEDFHLPKEEVLFINGMLKDALVEVTEEKEDFFSSSSPSATSGEDDGVPGPSRSRYPDCVEAILRRPELPERDFMGSRFKEQFSSVNGAVPNWDGSRLSGPARNPGTPSRSPRTMSPVRRPKIHWDLRGCGNSAQKWRSEFTRLREDLEKTFLMQVPYFQRPKEARKLNQAYKEMAKQLQRLQPVLLAQTHLPRTVNPQFDLLDRALERCVERGREIYKPATEPGVSRETLAPEMQAIREALDEQRVLLKNIRKVLAQGAWEKFVAASATLLSTITAR